MAATGIKETVRVKYIPTSGAYRHLKLQASIASRDLPMEKVTLMPNQWHTVSIAMMNHLKAKQKRKQQGIDVPDGGPDLVNRMKSPVDTTEQTRHEQIYDFELLVEGE